MKTIMPIIDNLPFKAVLRGPSALAMVLPFWDLNQTSGTR
jgi:hypothetical protein